MVCGDTRFERREDKNLLAGADFENASTAVADIQIAVMIEGDSRRNTHAFREQFCTSCAIDTIDVAFVPARDEQLAGQAERKTRCVHDVGYKRRHRTFWCD